MPLPAYSPDLAPSDYHIFRSMAPFLVCRKFNNEEDIKMGCREFFASKDENWYYNGLKQLSRRWIKCIAHDGLYFDE